MKKTLATMNNFDEMYKTICRLCLSQSRTENMYNLFDEKSADGLSCYGKSVINFCNIILRINDNLPRQMCKKCLILLKQVIRFKLTCENSEISLKKLYKISEETNGNFKENVCQYTLFNFYFPNDSGEMIKNSTKEVKTRNILPNLKNTHTLKSERSYKVDEEVIKKRNIKRHKFNETLNEISDNNSDSSLPKMTFKARQTRDRKLKSQKKIDLTCNICDKVLANKLSYKCHMQRHNGCQYICEICGKGFPMSHELNAHTVALHGTGQYLKCDHCEFKAPQKYLLVEHMRLHTGERPFTCDKCGQTFRRRAIWKKHLISHTEKSLQCKQCPKKFHRIADLNSHMNSSHERIYMFACSKCGCLYAKTRTVRKHMLEKHGVPKPQQGKIPKVMRGESNFFGTEN